MLKPNGHRFVMPNETLLVHEKIAAEFLPKVAAGLLNGANVAVKNPPNPTEIKAADEDWGTEYQDLILAVRIGIA